MSNKRIDEFKKLANDTIIESKARAEIMEKLAFAGTPRKQLEKDLMKARKEFEKARKDHNLSSSELAVAQKKVDDSNAAMTSSRKSIVDLNEVLKNMDLTGADSIKVEKSGDVSYIKDGKRFNIDIDDSNDVKLVPYQKKDKNLADTPDDVEEASDDDEMSGADLDAAIAEIDNSLNSDDFTNDEEFEAAAHLERSLTLVKSARNKFR